MNEANRQLWEAHGFRVVTCATCGQDTVTNGYPDTPTCTDCTGRP